MIFQFNSANFSGEEKMNAPLTFCIVLKPLSWGLPITTTLVLMSERMSLAGPGDDGADSVDGRSGNAHRVSEPSFDIYFYEHFSLSVFRLAPNLI